MILLHSISHECRVRLRLAFLVLCAFLQMTTAQNSWELVSPKTPNGIHSELTDVSFWSASGGVAVGSDQYAYYTLDSGKTWTPKATLAVFNTICHVDALHGIAARSIFNEDQDTELYAGIWNISDEGTTWTLKHQDDNFFTSFRGVGFWDTLQGCIIGDYHHFAGHTGITPYYTVDGGNFWASTDVSSLGTQLTQIYSLSIVDQLTGYAILWKESNYRLIRTTDAGHSWRMYGDRAFPAGVDGNVVNTLTGTIIQNGSRIFRSEDGGLTWQEQNNPNPNTLTCICLRTPSAGVAVGEGGTISSTTDGGAHWQSEPTLTTANLSKVYVSPAGNVIAIGSASTIIRGHIQFDPWLAPNGTIRLLAQNYPNPFNGSTTIRHELPSISSVSLKIFNVLGQLLATLVDEVKPVGTYRVQ